MNFNQWFRNSKIDVMIIAYNNNNQYHPLCKDKLVHMYVKYCMTIFLNHQRSPLLM